MFRIDPAFPFRLAAAVIVGLLLWALLVVAPRALGHAEPAQPTVTTAIDCPPQPLTTTRHGGYPFHPASAYHQEGC